MGLFKKSKKIIPIDVMKHLDDLIIKIEDATGDTEMKLINNYMSTIDYYRNKYDLSKYIDKRFDKDDK